MFSFAYTAGDTQVIDISIPLDKIEFQVDIWVSPHIFPLSDS